jgi:hypothetical protein
MSNVTGPEQYVEWLGIDVHERTRFRQQTKMNVPRQSCLPLLFSNSAFLPQLIARKVGVSATLHNWASSTQVCWSKYRPSEQPCVHARNPGPNLHREKVIVRPGVEMVGFSDVSTSTTRVSITFLCCRYGTLWSPPKELSSFVDDIFAAFISSRLAYAIHFP